MGDVIYSAAGHLLRRVTQIHDRIFDEEFAGRITPRQLALLITVRRFPDIAQITLSGAIAVDRSTIAEMVPRLESQGLIERHRSPTDGRRNVLRISSKGEALLDGLVSKVTGVSQRLLEPLSEEEQATLLHLLARLATVEDPSFPEYRVYALRDLESGVSRGDWRAEVEPK